MAPDKRIADILELIQSFVIFVTAALCSPSDDLHYQTVTYSTYYFHAVCRRFKFARLSGNAEARRQRPKLGWQQPDKPPQTDRVSLSRDGALLTPTPDVRRATRAIRSRWSAPGQTSGHRIVRRRRTMKIAVLLQR